MEDEALVSMIGQKKLRSLFNFFQDLLETKKPAEDIPQVENRTIKPMEIMSDKIKQKYKIFTRLTESQKLAAAKEASRQERVTKDLNYNQFVYGEIFFPSLAHIFYLIKEKYGGLQKEGGVFYDLGSGVGKGVLAASLLHQFDKCCGIELLESLYEMGQNLKESISSQANNIIEDLIDIEKNDGITLPEISFKKDDFLSCDWSDANIVFAASTCYEPMIMKQLYERSKLLKQGAFFITLTKKFPEGDDWQLLINVNHIMSWGETTVHIYKKITKPQLPDTSNANDAL